MRLIPLLALLPTMVLAKPWRGIEPGSSNSEDVLMKFGKPTQTLNHEGKEIMAYVGKEAIRGTSQAQFKIDPQSQVVEQVDVFPENVIDQEAVEGTYGPACTKGRKAALPCFVKKVSSDFQTYLHYAELGLAVFFKPDGKTVQSFVFMSRKK